MNKRKNNENKLFEIINNNSFTFEFISGIAGDRIQNEEEKKLFERLLRESDGDLYVKLLFYICHQIFDVDKARILWNEIIDHKKDLSRALNRNVEITVATLDYLTNIKDEIDKPKLIGEAFIGKIAEMTSVDLLTKLYNRQYLYLKIDEEIKRFKRYNAIFSLMIIDIDNFKSVNDTYGHQKGDEVLTKMAKVLKEVSRDLDICARYGGEEFCILLPHTKIVEAKKIADRVRVSVMNYFAKSLNLTVSIGVSCYENNQTTISKLIQNADKALYFSKNNGKNRVTVQNC